VSKARLLLVETRLRGYKSGMKAGRSMRVLGGKKLRPYWERFNRLQASADLLLGAARPPKGVFRFTSWAEFDEWKMKYRTQAGFPGKPTS
jgi:hypothetical protein